jgi:hypothetical protein
MKTEYYVEFDGKQIDLQSIEDIAKSTWKNDGNRMKDLKSLKLYYKPQEHKVYYVYNGETRGEEDSFAV